MLNGERLQDTWYGDRKPGLLLSALERVYAGVSASRRERARPDPTLVGRPIIVVGNITAGGTGKTPLVIRLCELLQEAGLSVGVISRGYGRNSSGAVTVTRDTAPGEGGDEPVLIARRCGVTVHVDEDREAAARAAFEAGADVVLADDGLQRGSLPRVMEFCVVDAARGFGNGRLLPAGPLREPVERLAQVDWVVSNGEGALEDVPVDLRNPLLPMRLRPGVFRRLDGTAEVSAVEAPTQFTGAVTAVAGMGNPERFFGTLAQIGLEGFTRRPFPDHHDYKSSEFADIGGTVLMTEKDAVKCAGLGLEDAWALQVDAELPPEWASEWVASVRALID